jgi:hypothetical protein
MLYKTKAYECHQRQLAAIIKLLSHITFCGNGDMHKICGGIKLLKRAYSLRTKAKD